jgi:hypothetical protein
MVRIIAKEEILAEILSPRDTTLSHSFWVIQKYGHSKPHRKELHEAVFFTVATSYIEYTEVCTKKSSNNSCRAVLLTGSYRCRKLHV